MKETITLPDGRIFPAYNGETLAWSIGLYFTHNERKAGFPRIKAVVSAMREHRPEMLAEEHRQMVKSSLCDPLFRHSAYEVLKVIESA